MLSSVHLSVCQKSVWTVFLVGRRFLIPFAFVTLSLAFAIKPLCATGISTVEAASVLSIFIIQSVAVAFASVVCRKALQAQGLSNIPSVQAFILYSVIFPAYDLLRE